MATVTFHVFGLTGGIGSGKSLVGNRLRARGLPVVDSDQLAREVVVRGSEGLREVVRAFGERMLTPEGDLDRGRLGALVFDDPKARELLQTITHPRVRALAAARFAELERAGEPLAGNEVPLLYEVGLERSLAPVVVVTAREATRIARIRARDGCSEEAVRARLRAQLPLEEKVLRADYVIDNDGEPAATLARADAVLDELCATLGVDAGRYPRR